MYILRRNVAIGVRPCYTFLASFLTISFHPMRATRVSTGVWNVIVGRTALFRSHDPKRIILARKLLLFLKKRNNVREKTRVHEFIPNGAGTWVNRWNGKTDEKKFHLRHFVDVNVRRRLVWIFLTFFILFSLYFKLRPFIFWNYFSIMHVFHAIRLQEKRTIGQR